MAKYTDKLGKKIAEAIEQDETQVCRFRKHIRRPCNEKRRIRAKGNAVKNR